VKAALTTWFIEARAIPISGPVLEEKAKDLTQALQQPDFNATSGWLSRWKTRNNSLQTTSRREERLRSYCSWRLGYQRPARPTRDLPTTRHIQCWWDGSLLQNSTWWHTYTKDWTTQWW